MIIRTNPPGALVSVDDNEVGLTPVAISPIYYGSRKIRLEKDGFETLTLIQSMPPPWYEIPPLDFFSETLVPGTIRDQRTFDYQLRPQCVVPQDELLTRAENLRRGTQMAAGVAPPRLRVNTVSPALGTPGGSPIGGQPNYQLPPAANGAAVPAFPMQGPNLPAGPIYTPPPSTEPLASPGGAPIYQPPPAMPPAGPAGPPNVGSQPFFPLPSGG